MKMPRIALGQISGRDETAISPAGAITMHVFSLTLFDRRNIDNEKITEVAVDLRVKLVTEFISSWTVLLFDKKFYFTDFDAVLLSVNYMTI